MRVDATSFLAASAELTSVAGSSFGIDSVASTVAASSASANISFCMTMVSNL